MIAVPMLTVMQPWASLIAIGAKRIETRSWAAAYRGPVLIHAGKAWGWDVALMCRRDPLRAALDVPLPPPTAMAPKRLRPGEICTGRRLPVGAVVAVAELVDCRSTSARGWQPDGLGGERPVSVIAPWVEAITASELAFGDYSPGRFGWILAEVRPLDELLPCKGHQGLRPPADPGIAREALRRAGVAS